MPLLAPIIVVPKQMIVELVGQCAIYLTFNTHSMFQVPA